MTEPHYVRFARALAFAGGVAATAGGCGMAVSPTHDDAATTNDDAAVLTDAGDACATCTCGLVAADAGLPYCSGSLVIQCGCAAVGPLAPPNLAA